MPAASSADLVLGAIRTAVQPLASVQDSAEVRLLRQMAEDFEAEVRTWTASSPDDDDRES